MADQRLRELERRYRETGALTDEVAYLRARLRAGELPRARLELLAALDHPGALGALEVSAQGGAELDQRGLARFGQPAAGRLILAAARLCPPSPDSPWLDEWVAGTAPLAERFLDAPGPETEAAFGKALERYLVASGRSGWQHVLQRRDGALPFDRIAAALYSLVHGDATAWLDPVLRQASPWVSAAGLREALEPWALTRRSRGS